MIADAKKTSAHPDTNRRGSLILCLILVALAAICVYANTVGSDFVWDDNGLVVDNPLIRSWSSIPRFFCQGINSRPDEGSYFHRPLQMISYTLDYSLWGLRPAGYHITSILLHAAAAAAVAWLAYLITGALALAGAAGLLFAVHPVHTEAVAYISGRADLLSALFMLLGFVSYVRWIRSRTASPLFLTLSCFALALLSKESALILPLLLLLYNASFKERCRWGGLSAIAGIALAYIIVRAALLPELIPPMEKAAGAPGIVERAPGFFAAVATYLKLLVVPAGLHMEHGKKVFNSFHPLVLCGLSATVASLAGAWAARKRAPLVSFAIAWFFIGLLPVSNLFRLNAYLAEHWLYVPSIGFFLVIAAFFNGTFEKAAHKKAVVAAFCCLLVCFSCLTVLQNRYWKDPIALFTRTLLYSPGNHHVYNNLGIAYGKKGLEQDAEAMFRKAIEANPR
ncbi:MAG TPA: tetratricopeptide repeat protein, partial [bacterium]|nr:tetratricopeptide repeat protein [bacterium]